MTLGQFIVTNIMTLHAQFVKFIQNISYFLFSIDSIKLEGQEHLRPDRVVVAVDELCYSSGMDDSV